MFTLIKEDKNKIIFLNYLFASIPLSIIIGNLAININVLIICLLGLLTYGSKIFNWEKKLYKNLIYFFFIYLIFITFFNNFHRFQENSLYISHLIKSFFYLRFLIFFLILKTLIKDKKLNLKILIISFSFFSCLISLDIIIQIVFEKNLLGLTISAYRPSGFFGNENIAGGYIQKFILFFIILILTTLEKKRKNFLLLPDSIFLFFFIIIFLTGNRMPALIFVITTFVYYLLEKKFKKIFIYFFLICTIILISLQTNYNRLNTQILSFISETKNILIVSPVIFNLNPESKEYQEISIKSNYLLHFNTSVQIWKKNKIFGHGLKSFPLNCSYEKNQTCNTHPHNYFLEILLDTGLIGLILMYSFILFGIKDFLKYYFSFKNKYKTFLLPFFLIIFFEFFPLRSSGSFFTTTNSVTIFLILPFFLNYEKIIGLLFTKKK